MDSICVVVTELMHNLGDPVVVVRLECFADESLELECAALALVVELIIKRFGNIGVHIDRMRRRPLQGAAIRSS